MAETGKSTSFWKSPLFFGMVATFLYLTGFVLFLWFIGTAPAEGLGWNEAGDFFAGAFAPLAFIWLVVAVFLQKSELEAQRETLEQQMEELKLSREELKLNREMLIQQADELRKQSESLFEQREIARFTRDVSNIETRIEAHLRQVHTEYKNFKWRSRGSDYHIFMGPIDDRFAKRLADDQFLEACETAISYGRQIANHSLIAKGDLSGPIVFFEELLSEMEINMELGSRFGSFPFNRLIDVLKDLQSKEIWSES